MAFPFRRDAPIIGAGKPHGRYLGRYRDPVTNEKGPEIWLPGHELVNIVGGPRSGKDTGLVNPNLLMREGVTNVVCDPRLEGAAITAPYCRTLGPVYMANPCNELVDIPGYEDLRSDRANLLKGPELDPDNPLCFDHLHEVVETIFPQEGDRNNPFFPLSSQALYAGLLKAELIAAKREKRDPSFTRVRKQATEADEFDPKTGAQIKGLRARIRRIMDEENDEQINSLLGGFAGEQSDGIRDVIATAAAYTRLFLSNVIASDEKNPRIDFTKFGQVPSTVYYGVSPKLAKAFALYLRLFTAAVLRPLFTPHKVPVCIWANEFYTMGRVPALDSSLGLLAGGKIELCVIVQSLIQLKEMHGDGWEAFFGNAAATILVGAARDDFTANYFSDHSGELTMRQPSAGLNFNPGGGIGSTTGDAYGRRPALMPQDLRNIPPGQGYIWLAGLNDPIPAMFPPYHADPVLRRRARANPFYNG
jgi:type IV secretory pathway TraG/TraD family ATPase VirD4